MSIASSAKEAFVISSVAAGIMLSGPSLVKAGISTDQNEDKHVSIETTQIVRYGHIGQVVENVQTKLTKLTLYNGSIDAVYGKKTENAVKQFQRLHHLKVDGIVGKQTLTKLTTLNSSTKEFRLGDQTEEVKPFQQQLKTLNYYNGQIDGIYGPLTLSAVKEYQQKNNLEVTGEINTPTQIHLLSNRNKKGKTLKTVKVKAAQTTEVNSSVTSVAKSLLGTAYVWGGTSPSGFDCSGFIKYVFEKADILLPRTVNEMWNYSREVQKIGIGDIVFFETYKPGPSHAGIYLGNGQFIHTSSSRGVTISDLSNSYWKERYLGAKRIPNS
ncbi:peptidoglycan-binding protein [Metabacillus litoralis]|uniref:C40 family peptidase n=1 Tax=Metabacillus litoralis TaxID=152268 RepID=UPI001CFDB4BD|nr:peptidoglycan-binding protein [Metabacillus litoralis]